MGRLLDNEEEPRTVPKSFWKTLQRITDNLKGFPNILGRLLDNEKEPRTVPQSYGSMVKDRESGSELRGRIWVSLNTTLTKQNR